MHQSIIRALDVFSSKNTILMFLSKWSWLLWGPNNWQLSCHYFYIIKMITFPWQFSMAHCSLLYFKILSKSAFKGVLLQQHWIWPFPHRPHSSKTVTCTSNFQMSILSFATDFPKDILYLLTFFKPPIKGFEILETELWLATFIYVIYLHIDSR